MSSNSRPGNESTSNRAEGQLRITGRAQATAPFRAYAVVVLVLGAVTACGCAPKSLPPLATPPVVEAHDGRIRDLQRDLATILDAPALRHGVLAVSVRSLTRGDQLFRYHADTLVMPASNMKLVTLAVAAERLGWDFTFETTIVTTGTLDSDGVLHGDLILRGSGDPSLGVGDIHAEQTLDAWAQMLADEGIRRVDGRLICDDQSIAGTGLGAGWSWDYLSAGYAAPVAGLQVNENAAQVTMTPGQAAGQAAGVVLSPPESGLTIVGTVTTVAAGSPISISLERARGETVVRASGSVPLGPDVVRYVAVDRPALYAARMFASALARHGIAVGDGIVPIYDVATPAPLDATETVRVRYQSPALRQLAVTMMKNSSNLYAETFLAILGRAPGEPASFEGGRVAIGEQLTTWTVPANAVVVSDGSGLSRYDYVTTDAIVAILSRMYQDVRHKEPWLAALPVAGVDGTMRDRFKGSAAMGQVRAKTGTISNVRALSGYVPSADGEWLAFSMIVNNVTAAGAEITSPIDQAVNRLAAFRR